APAPEAGAQSGASAGGASRFDFSTAAIRLSASPAVLPCCRGCRAATVSTPDPSARRGSHGSAAASAGAGGGAAGGGGAGTRALPGAAGVLARDPGGGALDSTAAGCIGARPAGGSLRGR